MRGTIPPSFGLMQAHSEEIMALLREAGCANAPVGVDLAETAMLFALQEAGMKVVDGQQIMLDAREIKSIDEITLLNQAAAMVDGVYHMIWEELKPGVRENEIVAKANAMLYEMGSDDVEAINAISGERCNPHPHNFTDRLIRPGDQAFFDILQAFNGYRTCYYRTFNVGRATPSQHDAYRQCRDWLDRAIELIRPGVGTDTVCRRVAGRTRLRLSRRALGVRPAVRPWPGPCLHERPIISRLVSLDHPMEIKTGMVFALETYCPATDGFSAARIEEEVVVTDTGCKVITHFPAEELPIANAVLMDHGMSIPRLDVEIVGEGRDVVLLHSLLSDRTSFDPLAARLKGERRLILVNLPGFGKSPPAGPAISDYADRRGAIR